MRKGATRQAGPMEMISADEVRELFEYRDGQLWWCKKTSRRTDLSKPAGCLDVHGYRVIRIKGRLYKEHRLIWLYAHGEWPVNNIDHIDGNGLNNCISNLREATQAENSRNTRKRVNNKSGLKGVSRQNRRHNWQAHICHNYKRHYLGSFDCKAAAHFAYLIASDEMHRDFARFE